MVLCVSFLKSHDKSSSDFIDPSPPPPLSLSLSTTIVYDSMLYFRATAEEDYQQAVLQREEQLDRFLANSSSNTTTAFADDVKPVPRNMYIYIYTGTCGTVVPQYLFPLTHLTPLSSLHPHRNPTLFVLFKMHYILISTFSTQSTVP